MSRIALPGPGPILVIALVLRVAWSALVGVDPVSDSAAYDIFARNIAFHGVYGFTPDQPGAFWAVGAAAIYAGAYLVFGATGVAVVAVNLVSSALTVVALWDLGRRWFGETEGRIAALLFALWPMAIQFTSILASELHFIALTLLGLMAWDRGRRILGAGFWVASLAAGLAFAGATYLRPIGLLIPAVLAIAVVLSRPRDSLAAILKAGVATAVIFACVAPWSARNERVFGEPVFMSTNFWANFWMGNHPGTNGQYAPLPESVMALSEVEREHALREMSLTQLREEPFAIVPRTAWKALLLHQRETIGIRWNEAGLKAWIGPGGIGIAKIVSTAWWYAMLAAALSGAALLVRRLGVWSALLAPPVWLWGYFTGVHAVIVVGDRYHMPSIPMIALLAAVAVSALLDRARSAPVGPRRAVAP